MKKTQHMTVSRKFVDIMTEYNKIQMEHRDASKNQVLKAGKQLGKPGQQGFDFINLNCGRKFFGQIDFLKFWTLFNPKNSSF
jgi:t-SNARE complex subunit (syntaxin)